jgi:hypothetical protein
MPIRTNLRPLVLMAFFMAFWPVATVSIAQTAMDSGVLPLRNLQLEVRQVNRSDEQRGGVEAGGAVHVGPTGQLGMQGQIRAQEQSTQRSGSATQQVLVLNGRSAAIALRLNVPVRVLQSFIRQGVVVIIQGTVLLEAGTGFMATPRWDGADWVQLEIAAQQALPSRSGAYAASTAQGATGQASAEVSSQLQVPLGEWTTIGQTDQTQDSSRSGLTGQSTSREQTRTEVQVRITVR